MFYPKAQEPTFKNRTRIATDLFFHWFLFHCLGLYAPVGRMWFLRIFAYSGRYPFTTSGDIRSIRSIRSIRVRNTHTRSQRFTLTTDLKDLTDNLCLEGNTMRSSLCDDYWFFKGNTDCTDATDFIFHGLLCRFGSCALRRMDWHGSLFLMNLHEWFIWAL